jgi:hypothetical protein
VKGCDFGDGAVSVQVCKMKLVLFFISRRRACVPPDLGPAGRSRWLDHSPKRRQHIILISYSLATALASSTLSLMHPTAMVQHSPLERERRAHILTLCAPPPSQGGGTQSHEKTAIVVYPMTFSVVKHEPCKKQPASSVGSQRRFSLVENMHVGMHIHCTSMS